ncbi:hypothetical protein [Streptomyces cinereoruber]|uniref:hypothetical protein n=1 Tax=Streptomyces cinereoruber TaxID=67260 RepID=UPI00339A8933
MTTKSKTSVTLMAHCPACRTRRQARQVGMTTINGRRHFLIQCADRSCELTWASRVRPT